MKTLAGNLWEAALNLFYPPVCQICLKERANAAEGYVGGKCWSRIRFIMPPFCRQCGATFEGSIHQEFVCGRCADWKCYFRFARSAVVANDLLFQVIRLYKYHQAFCFEPFLTGLLTGRAAPALAEESWDFIVPVPLFSVREREREFNQATRLARALSGTTGIPVNTTLLKRVRPTPSQTRLNRSDRAKNVQAAFALKAGARLEGKKIIVLDDIFTTGATTNACARVLRQAGAADIGVWTLARGA